MVAVMTGRRKHRGSINTNSSVSTALSAADFSRRPKSSVSSFDAARSGVASSFASTAPSELSNNGGDAPVKLETKIRRASRHTEWTNQSPQNMFLPDDEIQTLICAETIREELVEHAYTEDFLPHIVPDRRKLFAILTLMGKSGFITKLVQEGIDDSHLPFVVDLYTGSLSYSVKGGTGAHETRKVETFTPSFDSYSCWKSHDSDAFFTTQWRLLAPYFDMLCPCDDGCSTATEAPHYIFKPQEIPPFTKPNEEWESLQQSGGFSVVRKVHIHPAHRSHCRFARCVRHPFSPPMTVILTDISTETLVLRGQPRREVYPPRLQTVCHTKRDQQSKTL